MKHWLSGFVSVIVLLGGYFALQAATDDWQAWSTESARRLDIREKPRQLPDSLLVDSHGGQLALDDYERPIMVVDFIYTQCPTVCISLGLEFKQLQADLVAMGIEKQVQLLSLSFDLENDGPAQLRDYLARFGAQDSQWSAATFANDEEKQRALDDLGVIVLEDESQGFIHNAGVYLVVDGRVVDVFDYQQRSELLLRIRELSS